MEVALYNTEPTKQVNHVPSSALILSIAKFGVEAATTVVSSRAASIPHATHHDTNANDDSRGSSTAWSAISIVESDWDLLFGESSSPAIKIIRKLLSLALQHPELFDSIRQRLMGVFEIERPLDLEVANVSAINMEVEMNLGSPSKDGSTEIIVQEHARKSCAFPFFQSPIDIFRQYGGGEQNALDFAPWSNSERSWEVRQKVVETFIENTSSPETVELKKIVLQAVVKAGQSEEAKELGKRARNLVIETGAWKYGLAIAVARGVIRCAFYGAGSHCPLQNWQA